MSKNQVTPPAGNSQPPLFPPNTTIGRYTLQKVIGTGSYSQIWKAVSSTLQDGQGLVAIKICDKKKLSDEDVSRLETECIIHSRLDHPNIVKLHEVFEVEKRVFFVMELASKGDLLDLVNTAGPFTEEQSSLFFSQLVDAIEYAHLSGFVHRDIKLDNILIAGNGRLLIADWGLATCWDMETTHSASVGSIPYASPEIVQGNSYYGPEVDVWSLGVVLYALVTGKLPFRVPDVSDEEQRKNIVFPMIIEAQFKMPAKASAELQRVLTIMLCPDPSRRASITEVKYSAWMRKFHPQLERTYSGHKMFEQERKIVPAVEENNCKLM